MMLHRADLAEAQCSHFWHAHLLAFDHATLHPGPGPCHLEIPHVNPLARSVVGNDLI